jgi:phage terminase small subunit
MQQLFHRGGAAGTQPGTIGGCGIWNRAVSRRKSFYFGISCPKPGRNPKFNHRDHNDHEARLMPRKSSVDVAFPDSPASRVRPPDDLTGDARTVFCDLVISTRPDHFIESDIPTLCIFCEAIVLAKAATAGLKADGYVTAEGRPSGWLNILAQATRTTSTFGRMLRLNPSARLLTPSPSPEPAPTISAYERLALEAQRDGRN